MLIFISHSTGETFEVIAWDLNMNIYVAREYGMGLPALHVPCFEGDILSGREELG